MNNNTKKPKKKNPRKGANLLSQLLMLWIFPIVWKGVRTGFTSNDITTCLKEDLSEDLSNKLEREWLNRLKRSTQTNRNKILQQTIVHIHLATIIIDGFLVFLYILFRSLTPFFLAQLLCQFQKPININGKHQILFSSIVNNSNTNHFTLLNENETNYLLDNSMMNNETTMNFGNILHYIWNDIFWLSNILVISLILTIFFGHHTEYKQRLFGARLRIACSSLVFRKTLRLSKNSSNKISAGYLINLLSNDVGRLDYGLIYSHYIWILPFQASFICYLMWRNIGWASIIGVVVLLLKTIPIQTGFGRLSLVLRKKVAERTDKRIGIMNEIIQGIQVIKMYAWEKPFNAIVAKLRQKEIKQIRITSYIRGITLSIQIITTRSTLFITILVTILLGQNVTADVVFSTAHFFQCLILTTGIYYPLAISFGVETLVSIDRIQEFLLMEEKDEIVNGFVHQMDIHDTNGKTINAIEIQNLSATWKIDDGIELNTNKINHTLNDIVLNIKHNQCYAIIGPVGAGKSSLFHLLLGELQIQSGNCLVSGNISYASQEPWLFSGTIRNNILFGQHYDEQRYNEIIDCCALKTDFKQLPYGDSTIVGERGMLLSGGQRARISLARSIYKSAEIYLLDDPLSAVDVQVGKYLFDKLIGPNGRLKNIENATILLITHQLQFLENADQIVIIENGSISLTGSYKELSNSNLNFKTLLKNQTINNGGDDGGGIKLNDVGNTTEALHANNVELNSDEEQLLLKKKTKSAIEKNRIDVIKKNDTIETQKSGNVSFKIWIQYFRAGGNLCILLFNLFILITTQIIISSTDYFVSYWTQQEYLRLHQPNVSILFTTNEYLYIFGGLVFAVIVMCIFRSCIFFNVCMNASKNLHNKMFTCILNAPMRFFDKNPSGQILNRFSKDIGVIDDLLPRALLVSCQLILLMIGILVLICMVNPLIIIALCFAMFAYGFILKLNLKPLQELKRLEGITKSPVFSYLSTTLSGLTTIRSHRLQLLVIKEFDELQNIHSSVWQLITSANTASAIWLDCISIAFVTCVTFSFIDIDDNSFGGNVGLAITQSLILTGMENNGIQMPPKHWPTNGKIQFKNMSLRYDPDEAPILKNIQFDIDSNWKVGIVGRTGAGKSSLINAMFRLSTIDGEILIDELDTSRISLETLRSKISIIPQNPVLFSATIRYNLDPFNSFSDDLLWTALEDVKLKEAIPSLDYLVTEGGHNLSVGQRQLICLARAILRNNKILILDEATANVDPQTDKLIQHTIRKKFNNCTILMIAHRLHTVMDSDRILVLDNGNIIEFQHPSQLMTQQNNKCVFMDMLSTTISDNETIE